MQASRSVDMAISISAKALFGFYGACLAASLIGSAWLAYKFGISPESIGLVLGWCTLAAASIYCVERRWWVVVLAIVLALRLGMAWATQGAPSENPDPRYYATLAQHLANGSDFVDVVDGVEFRAHAPRLYSYLLAAVYFVTGGSKLAPLLLNLAVDAATAFLIFRTAGRLGANTFGAASAGVLYAIWPHVVVGSAFAQKEGLACLLTIACVWTLAEQRMRPIRYGFFLGLLGMAQPAFFLMAAGFPLALLVRQRLAEVARFLAIAAAVTILVLVPQTIRNFYATGGFAPLTTGIGMNLYINAFGAYDFPDQFNHLPEAAWSKAMIGAGWTAITADPLSYATHQSKMMFITFALEHGQLWPLQGVAGLRLRPTDFLIIMQLPLIALWAGTAACLFYRRSDRLMIAILALVLIYTFTVSIWFEFGERHRAYLLPILLAWAATLLSARAPASAPTPG